ncbi:hypothetical protein ACE6H2_014002 [Prunus campanulata]
MATFFLVLVLQLNMVINDSYHQQLCYLEWLLKTLNLVTSIFPKGISPLTSCFCSLIVKLEAQVKLV